MKLGGVGSVGSVGSMGRSDRKNSPLFPLFLVFSLSFSTDNFFNRTVLCRALEYRRSSKQDLVLDSPEIINIQSMV